MSLRNHHWTSLSGEPITGRVPPRLLVMNDAQLSQRQLGEVAHCYRMLSLAMLVSIIPYMVQERRLLDGTRVRLVSSYGEDTVYVWPIDGEGDGVKLPHGFVVVAEWAAPVFR